MSASATSSLPFDLPVSYSFPGKFTLTEWDEALTNVQRLTQFDCFEDAVTAFSKAHARNPRRLLVIRWLPPVTPKN